MITRQERAREAVSRRAGGDTPAAWFRAAVAAAAEAKPDELVDASRKGGGLRSRLGPGRFHPLGPHANEAFEVCVALTGEPALEIGGVARRFPPRGVALVKPGVVHCEGWLRRDRGYTLMWVIVGSPSLLALVSRYTPRRGWDCPARQALSGGAAARLHAALASGPGGGPAGLRAWQPGFVSALGQMLEHAAAGTRSRADPQSGEEARHGPLLEHVRGFIVAHLDRPLTAERLARLTRLTPNYLNRLFRRWSGENLHAYVTRLRMERAMRWLSETPMLAKEVALRVGYTDPLYFSRAFHRYYGSRPSEVAGLRHDQARSLNRKIGDSMNR